MIKKYVLAREWSASELQDKVNDYIAKGWELHGTLQTTREVYEGRSSDKWATLYIQPMVKQDTPPKKPTREEWIRKKLASYQQYYRENGKYYIDTDWTPTLYELKADLNKAYDFEVGDE